MLERVRLLALTGVLVGCGSGDRASAPDLILHHGKIFTADSTRQFVEALAIKGQRVVAIGPSDSVRRLGGSRTREIDLGGKVVVPGFNDAHDHIGPSLPSVRFATSDNPTPEPGRVQVLDSVKAIAARTAPGKWIETEVGERILGDPQVRRAELDRVAPKNPVRLQAWTGHGMVLNSAALERLGVSDTVRDPVGGRFERYRDGRLTGLIEEYAEFNLWRVMNGGPDSALRAPFEAKAKEAIAFGITSIQNMATSYDAATTARAIRALALPIRLRIMRFPGSTPNGLDLVSWRRLTSPDSNVRVSGTKWVLDGTPIERLAVLRAPYSDRPGWFGRLDFPPDTLKRQLQEILAANDQPILHAVGDSTIALMFSTMSQVAPDSTWRRLRPRIEHGEGLAPDLVPAAKRLGVILVQNPTHFDLSVAHDRYGERVAILQPVRSVLEQGIPLALGSDGPINPFLNLMLAVSRRDSPQEALTVPQAVTAYTLGSAYAEFAEGEKGRLIPGMLADLAVLSQDIFSVSPDRILETKCLLTLLGGQPVWNPEGLVAGSAGR